MEALQKQVKILKRNLAKHEKLQLPMQGLYTPRSSNHAKAQANWEAKSKWLMSEIFKYETYVESLRNAMSLRMKKRGDKVLEKALISPDFQTTARKSKKGLQEETIHETEEPTTPGPGATAFGHKREIAMIDEDDDDDDD